MSSSIWAIAMHELAIARRNRWVTAFAVLFAGITFLISYFGMVTSGYSGFQDFTRTAASLVNLSGFIVPLFALLLGVFGFIANREYLDLIVSQPVSRTGVLAGKFIGMVLTVTGATLIGFGLPGVVFAASIGVEGIISYAAVVGYSLMLGVVFVSIAMLISIVTKREQLALGIAIGVWFYFEVLSGVLVMGTTLYFSHKILKSLLLALLMANPIDLTRVLSMLAVGGPHFFGAAGATLIKITGSSLTAGLIGIVSLVVWVVVPFLAVVQVFRRQNLSS